MWMEGLTKSMSFDMFLVVGITFFSIFDYILTNYFFRYTMFSDAPTEKVR